MKGTCESHSQKWINVLNPSTEEIISRQPEGDAMDVEAALEFGETYVNREHFEAMQGFHAGVKKSGIGGADSKHGIDEYLVTHVTYLDTHYD